MREAIPKMTLRLDCGRSKAGMNNEENVHAFLIEEESRVWVCGMVRL
jgi:hypothetical protein